MKNAINHMYGRVNEVNRNVLESALGCNEIGARTQAVLARQHFEVVETCLDAGAKQWQSVVEARNPLEFFVRQAEILSDLGEKLAVMTQEVVDIHNQARVELGLCVEDSLKSVQDLPTFAKAA